MAPTFVAAIHEGQHLDGRFLVGAHLGGGTFGDVFRVVDLRSGRSCALKVLKQAFKGAAEWERRFALEAKVSARTRCDGVVETLETGRLHDGRAFLLMELLSGSDLECYAQGRALPPAEAVSYLAQASRAIEAAHRAQIIHRDLKPSNLFRLEGPPGSLHRTEGPARIKVLDFGIARFLDAPSGHTQGFLGSPLWSAPEQVLDPTAVSARSDLFALGAVLYTLLAGTPPYPRDLDIPSLLALVRKGGFLPLELAAPHLPGELLTAVSRAMASAPDDRFGSAREFADALEQLLPTLTDVAVGEPARPGPKAVLERTHRRGHALIALSEGEGRRLVGTLGIKSMLIARDGQSSGRLREEFPGRHVVAFDIHDAMFWRKLDLATAGQLAAMSDDDDLNAAVARSALDALEPRQDREPLRMVVRLEDRVFRAAHGGELLRLARTRGVDLRFVSASLSQVRRGLLEGRPGRFSTAGARRTHVALCGAGALADDLLIALARQAYEFGSERTLLSLINLGGAGPSRATVARVIAANTVEVQELDADPTDAASVARALQTLLFGDAPVSIIHCVGTTPGGATASCRVLAEVASQQGVPLPFFVVYEPAGVQSRPGVGPHVVILRDDLEEVERRSVEEDRLAREFHETYLRHHGNSGGAAAVPWERLAPEYQDENRNAADHALWKLDVAGLALLPADGRAGLDRLEPSDVELLARLEHARWAASRSLAGWRRGELRDDRLRLHPSLVPWEALSETEREKDRTQVRRLPELLARSGRVVRDQVCALWLDAATDWSGLVSELTRRASQLERLRLVVLVPLLDEARLRLAEDLLNARVTYTLCETSRAVDAQRLAKVALGARSRIRVADDDRTIRETLFGLAVRAIVSETTVCGFESPGRWSARDGWIDLGWLADPELDATPSPAT